MEKFDPLVIGFEEIEQGLWQKVISRFTFEIQEHILYKNTTHQTRDFILSYSNTRHRVDVNRILRDATLFDVANWTDGYMLLRKSFVSVRDAEDLEAMEVFVRYANTEYRKIKIGNV